MPSEELSIAGIADSSTIDYIGKVSAVIYLCGCPFRCPWCQNPDLALGSPEVCKNAGIDSIIHSLKQDFLIEAVCITGGEPLMQKETVSLLWSLKKETNLLLKIDTNGFYPEILAKALPYLDFLSMDLKAPLDEGYDKAVGLAGSSASAKIKKSLDLLKKWDKPKEARTTIIPGLTDKIEDLLKIAETVEDAGFKYYTLQQFRPGTCLDKSYDKMKSPGQKYMKEIGQTIKKRLPDVRIRIITQQKGVEEIGSPS